jgi:hypothetical protein
MTSVTITRLLHDLTRDIPFKWTDKCQVSFNTLKKALSMSPVLALPRDQGKFQLETDASDIVTGAVLSQEQEDGTFRSLGYFSKSLSNAEQHYMTYNKELLGIMHRLEEWRSLLIRAHEPFKILTDHRNLVYFKDPQKLMSWQVNWMTKLQDYDFVIKHIGGDTNGCADALSRLEGVEKAPAKVAIVLPDWLFSQYLSRAEEKELGGLDCSREIFNCHDSPTAGHFCCWGWVWPRFQWCWCCWSSARWHANNLDFSF